MTKIYAALDPQNVTRWTKKKRSASTTNGC